MRRIKEVIVVEGRYDKNTVAQSVDCTIIETSGFGVFSDKEKIALLRRLAEKRGLVILTDSDKAGFFIRGRLKGMLDDHNIKHAYIPDIYGREKRKRSSSKEEKIGVEGMSSDFIILALERAGATFEDVPVDSGSKDRITKTDMYNEGLSGSHGSAQKRLALLDYLGLPKRLSVNSMLDVLNILFTREEFLELVSEISADNME